MARGNRRQAIFTEDGDYQRFLTFLGREIERRGWRCHAYCLMPNHFHLLVEIGKADLSEGMQRVKGGYAQWFNRRHELDGHLFQGRFKAVAIASTWHLLEVSRYIVLNPVRAGLCRHPGAWRWSSYRAMVGAARKPSFLTLDRLLEHFGAELKRARAAFAAFVADAARLPHARSP